MSRVGLIPARAGKTGCAQPCPSSAPAHPRTGGENDLAVNGNFDGNGSSPHGRGKHTSRSCKPRPGRLIPARAGKTAGPLCVGRVVQAHPRTGGENQARSLHSDLVRGSSPHGRGKLNNVGRGLEAGRLIPARAGKTLSPLSRASRGGAHPRTGGENVIVSVLANTSNGSSPHGRGKQTEVALQIFTGRLIPARAGKTLPPHPPGAATPAHPRTGGENPRPARRIAMSPGSSPHGRGKPNPRQPNRLPGRLIPARAGKTPRYRRPHKPRTAHPRTGGENSARGLSHAMAGGSSPHGRGKHGYPRPWRAVVRLIPARAGKTLILHPPD